MGSDKSYVYLNAPSENDIDKLLSVLNHFRNVRLSDNHGFHVSQANISSCNTNTGNSC